MDKKTYRISLISFIEYIIFLVQELVAKRTEQMKKHVEYREQKVLEWNEQKPRRLELRNCEYTSYYWLVY